MVLNLTFRLPESSKPKIPLIHAYLVMFFISWKWSIQVENHIFSMIEPDFSFELETVQHWHFLTLLSNNKIELQIGAVNNHESVFGTVSFSELKTMIEDPSDISYCLILQFSQQRMFLHNIYHSIEITMLKEVLRNCLQFIVQIRNVLAQIQIKGTDCHY